MNLQPGLSRRGFLGRLFLAPAGALLAACSDTLDSMFGRGPVTSLRPTPACGDDDDATVAQTEGPYFTPNSPERTDLLEAGMAGTPLILTGRVLTTDCQPVTGALLDFWQCDSAGVYDNTGYTLRGHQFTGADGSYRLETVYPGLYPGRTRHIHVKAQRPDGAVLTTQLYFPDETANARDGIFNAALLVAYTQNAGDGKVATFDFVLA